jgi:hypothetical protein
MEVTFGEWVRWMVARHGMDRGELAKHLGVDKKSVTNLFRYDTPDRCSDLTIARLAQLFRMPEPELLKAYKAGLPDPPPISNGAAVNVQIVEKGKASRPASRAGRASPSR